MSSVDLCVERCFEEELRGTMEMGIVDGWWELHGLPRGGGGMFTRECKRFTGTGFWCSRSGLTRIAAI